MIIPSIDIMNGHAVQLIGGKKKAIDAGVPFNIAKEFSVAGELAVIDLDAALGKGSNECIIKDLVEKYPCRVGGGIRDYASAAKWLDRGAEKIILGTATEVSLLSRLPKDRVIVALDSFNGKVVTEGWTKETNDLLFDRIHALKEHVGGFLVTFVEDEGRMQGLNRSLATRVVCEAGDVSVTVAGGVKDVDEISFMDQKGCDVQVGMSLYSGEMSLAEGIMASVRFDKDGLCPTVVVDETGVALGMVWSDRESIAEAVHERKGIYHSRSRGLWVKGETSGNEQELIRIALDCDRDVLRFVVKQKGSGFCHQGTWTCWGEDQGLSRLYRRMRGRLFDESPAGSYTKELFQDSSLLEEKIQEEAKELAEARTHSEVTHEISDLIYFAFVKAAQAGVSLDEIERELFYRSLKVTRRSGKKN